MWCVKKTFVHVQEQSSVRVCPRARSASPTCFRHGPQSAASKSQQVSALRNFSCQLLAELQLSLQRVSAQLRPSHGHTLMPVGNKMKVHRKASPSPHALWRHRCIFQSRSSDSDRSVLGRVGPVKSSSQHKVSRVRKLVVSPRRDTHTPSDMLHFDEVIHDHMQLIANRKVGEPDTHTRQSISEAACSRCFDGSCAGVETVAQPGEVGGPRAGSAIHRVTRDWLCEHRLVPCENYASGHCWWVANAEITGLCIQEAQRRVVAFASLHALPPTICDGLTAEFTHKEHIAVAVHALRSWYKDGLLVLHAQCSTAWLFLTTGECRYISMPVASAWKAEHTGVAVMMYSQTSGPTREGHVVSCLPQGGHLRCCTVAHAVGNQVPITHEPPLCVGMWHEQNSSHHLYGSHTFRALTQDMGFDEVVASQACELYPDSIEAATHHALAVQEQQPPPHKRRCGERAAAQGASSSSNAQIELWSHSVPGLAPEAVASLADDRMPSSMDSTARRPAVGHSLECLHIDVHDPFGEADSPASISNSQQFWRQLQMQTELQRQTVAQADTAEEAPRRPVQDVSHVSMASARILELGLTPELASPPPPSPPLSSLPSSTGDRSFWEVLHRRTAANAGTGEGAHQRMQEAPPAIQPVPLPSLQRAMPPADFVDDPAGEVDYWFIIVANAPAAVAQDVAFWQRMPLYSQYITQKSFDEVLADCMAGIRGARSLDVSVEQASRMESSLGVVTLLPLVVVATFLHRGCGLPDIFAFDLFQACLASCQNMELAVACYADRSRKFSCRARWWACPPGDPNAGKSPTCSIVSGWFRQLVNSHRQLFHPVDHFIGVGNNGRIQERLRKLFGTLLLIGPETKPVLDPDFPARGKTDHGKYMDWTRWLECANGGAFEWGTGVGHGWVGA